MTFSYVHEDFIWNHLKFLIKEFFATTSYVCETIFFRVSFCVTFYEGNVDNGAPHAGISHHLPHQSRQAGRLFDVKQIAQKYFSSIWNSASDQTEKSVSHQYDIVFLISLAKYFSSQLAGFLTLSRLYLSVQPGRNISVIQQQGGIADLASFKPTKTHKTQ